MSDKMILRGDHCRCTTCQEHFNSTRAFDMHRVGRFGVDRRCMTTDEMLFAGMAKNSGGWWVTRARPMTGTRRC